MFNRCVDCVRKAAAFSRSFIRGCTYSCISAAARQPRHACLAVASAALLSTASATAFAQVIELTERRETIVRWANSQGKVQFSNVPPGKGWVVSPAPIVARKLPAASRARTTSRKAPTAPLTPVTLAALDSKPACTGTCTVRQEASIKPLSAEAEMRTQILREELEVEQKELQVKAKQRSDLQAVASGLAPGNAGLSTVQDLTNRVTREIELHEKNKQAIAAELLRIR